MKTVIDFANKLQKQHLVLLLDNSKPHYPGTSSIGQLGN